MSTWSPVGQRHSIFVHVDWSAGERPQSLERISAGGCHVHHSLSRDDDEHGQGRGGCHDAAEGRNDGENGNGECL